MRRSRQVAGKTYTIRSRGRTSGGGSVTPPTPSFILLANGTDHLLLANATDKILRP